MQESASTNAARALLGALRLVSYEEGVARIAPTGPSGAGFLLSRAEKLGELFSSAAQRPVRVEIAQPERAEEAAPPARRSDVEIDPKLRDHPVVRDALELFNAQIVRVEPSSEKSSTRSA